MEEKKHYLIKLDGSESEELSMSQMAKKETNTEKGIYYGIKKDAP